VAAGRGTKGLAALLAAAGAYQIAEWLQAGVRKVRQSQAGAKVARAQAVAGEIRVETEGTRWTLTADLHVEPGSTVWLWLTGPREQTAVALPRAGSPLAFSLDPGPPGTYRFWLVPSRRRQETTRSLSRKASNAIAMGEFRAT